MGVQFYSPFGGQESNIPIKLDEFHACSLPSLSPLSPLPTLFLLTCPLSYPPTSRTSTVPATSSVGATTWCWARKVNKLSFSLDRTSDQGSSEMLQPTLHQVHLQKSEAYPTELYPLPGRICQSGPRESPHVHPHSEKDMAEGIFQHSR